MFCAVQPNRIEQEISIILTKMGGSILATNDQSCTNNRLPHDGGGQECLATEQKK